MACRGGMASINRHAHLEAEEDRKSRLEVCAHQILKPSLRDRRQRVEIIPWIAGHGRPLPLMLMPATTTTSSSCCCCCCIRWPAERVGVGLMCRCGLAPLLLLALEPPPPQPGKDQELVFYLLARSVGHRHAREKDAAQGQMDEAQELAVCPVVGGDTAEGQPEPAQEIKLPLHHPKVREHVRIRLARQAEERHLPPEVRQQGLDLA
jgi:hypothetical protein